MERQTAETLDQIRRDHVARYEWAAREIGGNAKTVIDYGAGIGYGSVIMAQAGAQVIAIDISDEAHAYGEKHWKHERVKRVTHDLMRPIQIEADAAVAFEIIEHLQDPREFLRSIKATTLYASVPNEIVTPWRPYILHHHRHYTPEELAELLAACGWQIEEWLGQGGREHELERNLNGQTIVVRAVRAECPINAVDLGAPVHVGWQHPTGSAPESVCILGLGPSRSDFFDCMIPHDFIPPWKEVWGINVGIRFPHDLLWCMDNLPKELQRYGTEHYADQLRASVKPIITSEADPSCPAAVEYPLKDVLAYWGHWPVLPQSSLPAVLAYAGFIGAKSIYLFGVDYTWTDARREAGALWTSFWLGRLVERGVQINITESSTLLEARDRIHNPDYAQFYGYSIQPNLKRLFQAPKL